MKYQTLIFLAISACSGCSSSSETAPNESNSPNKYTESDIESVSLSYKNNIGFDSNDCFFNFVEWTKESVEEKQNDASFKEYDMAVVTFKLKDGNYGTAPLSFIDSFEGLEVAYRQDSANVRNLENKIALSEIHSDAVKHYKRAFIEKQSLIQIEGVAKNASHSHCLVIQSSTPRTKEEDKAHLDFSRKIANHEMIDYFRFIVVETTTGFKCSDFKISVQLQESKNSFYWELAVKNPIDSMDTLDDVWQNNASISKKIGEYTVAMDAKYKGGTKPAEISGGYFTSCEDVNR